MGGDALFHSCRALLSGEIASILACTFHFLESLESVKNYRKLLLKGGIQKTIADSAQAECCPTFTY